MTILIVDDRIQYAGLLKRLLANLYDLTILAILTVVITVPTWMMLPTQASIVVIGTVLLIIISMTYFIGFWASLGQTPGKMSIGIRIIASNRKPFGLRVALLRYLGCIISTALLCIGFIIIAFQNQKRGLHDYIAGTIVILDQ